MARALPHQLRLTIDMFPEGLETSDVAQSTVYNNNISCSVWLNRVEAWRGHDR